MSIILAIRAVTSSTTSTAMRCLTVSPVMPSLAVQCALTLLLLFLLDGSTTVTSIEVPLRSPVKAPLSRPTRIPSMNPTHEPTMAPSLPATNYTCLGSAEKYLWDSPIGRDFHFSGAALGGLFVLEPWITPSLFYQFLGPTSRWGSKDAPNHVGMDAHTFCEALGQQEANRQLRIHWATWVTEEIIEELAEIGVDHLRIPVPDWMFIPYEPFVECWAGSLDFLDKIIRWCGDNNIGVLLDVHAMRDSQNGYDNSGKAMEVIWNTSDPTVSTFQHWPIRSALWAGQYDIETASYLTTNMSNIEHSIEVVRQIVLRYRDNSVVVGVEPANEPWQEIPIDVIQYFYWECYKLVRKMAPRWVILFHDSFRFNVETWGTFAQGCPNFAIDTHVYQAWDPPLSTYDFQASACQYAETIAQLESVGIPVVVGEWSLATDNCAFWLNGFQDNVPGYPMVACTYVPCAPSYLKYPDGSLAVPSFNPSWGPDITEDPRGTGQSFMSYGQCPIDQPWSDSDLSILALAKLFAFDYNSHGQFMWNFRTELEAKWSFLQATANGWLPKGPYSNEVHAQMLQTCMSLLLEAPTLSPTTIPTIEPTPFPTAFSTDLPSVLPTVLPPSAPNSNNTSILQQVFISLTFNFYLAAAVIFTGGMAVFYFVKYRNPVNSISTVGSAFLNNRYDGYTNLDTSISRNVGGLLVLSRIEDEHHQL